MSADSIVPFWNRMFGHALQVAIGRTVDALRVGEGFGEIRLRKSEELLLIKRFVLSVHRQSPKVGSQVLHKLCH